jgi:hypothetical protein
LKRRLALSTLCIGTRAAMVRAHQPGQAAFRSIPPEDGVVLNVRSITAAT